jgi:adenylylsulfate reductase subunit B
MSIQIQKNKCIGCGNCIEVCPGNLLKKDKQGKAEIRHFRDCWGCTSCVKECKQEAICFYLGADMGGRGSTLTFSRQGDMNLWKIRDAQGKEQILEVDSKASNKY